jgi:hypothetical protein
MDPVTAARWQIIRRPDGFEVLLARRRHTDDGQ